MIARYYTEWLAPWGIKKMRINIVRQLFTVSCISACCAILSACDHQSPFEQRVDQRAPHHSAGELAYDAGHQAQTVAHAAVAKAGISLVRRRFDVGAGR